MNFNCNRKQNCWSCVFLALLALALSACASVIRQSDETTAKDELIALQDAWVAAEIAGDAEALYSLMDERIVSTFSSGETVDREGYVDWIVNADIDPFSADLDRIEIHGDTAVVICFVGRTKITWIAVRKSERWLVVAQTFTKMKSSD